MGRLLLWSAVIAASVAVMSGCASFDAWQRKAIFQPALASKSAAAPDVAEEFDIKLANGDTVHAWYVPAEKNAKNASTVLFLHGARRNLYESAWRIEHWQAMGFNVLAIDYRGFGRSTTLLPSEETAIEDSEAAFAELTRRQPDPAKRIVYGYSLGGALAIELAARVDGMAGVVIESSFTRIADVVRASKWGWVPGVSLLVTQEFNSEARIAKVNEPLLFIHGTQDGVVPHTMSDRLAAAAVAVPKEFKRVLKVDGARHWGAISVGGERYVRAVREFVQLASGASASTAASTSAGVMAR